VHETTDSRPIAGFLQGYVFVLSGQAVAAIVSLLISVWLARTMSVEDFGVYSLFFAILLMAWQLPAFVDSPYVRYARTAASSEARQYLRVNLVFKLRTAALMVGVSPLLGLALSRWAFPDKATAIIFAMAVISGAGLTFLTSLTADFLARERLTGYAIGNIAYYVAVLALLGWTGATGPTAVAGIFVGCAVGAGGVALAVLARRVWPLLPIDPAAAARMASLGKWILYAGLLAVALQRIDMLVAARLLSREDLGLYGAASRLLSALMIFLNAAASLYLTRSPLAVHSTAGQRAYWHHTMTLTALLLLLVMGLIVLAPALVDLFFGARYAAAAAPIRSLFIGHVPLIPALPLAGLLYALDDSRSVFVARAWCLGATIVANAVLTPRLGMTGPGWAFGIGYLAYLACLAIAVARRTGTRAVRVVAP
jgi:O-antigen/teichoic acid export membrane protein